MSEKEYIRSSGFGNWDWWKENPREIILLAFILVLFFFVEWLPPQGWGIDARPEQPAAEAIVE